MRKFLAASALWAAGCFVAVDGGVQSIDSGTGVVGPSLPDFGDAGGAGPTLGDAGRDAGVDWRFDAGGFDAGPRVTTDSGCSDPACFPPTVCGADGGACVCNVGHRLCEGVCTRCPDQGIPTTCSGSSCVALVCKPGAVLTAQGCEQAPFPPAPPGTQTAGTASDSTIFLGGNRALAFRLDRFGMPVLAFVNHKAPGDEHVVVTRWNGSQWAKTVVDSSSDLDAVSLALDEGGTAYVAYLKSEPTTTLFLATVGIDGGVKREVVSNRNIYLTGTRTEVLRTESGVVHVAFRKSGGAFLATRSTNGAWTEELVTNASITFATMAMGPSRPVFATQRAVSNGIFLHTPTGNQWNESHLYDPGPSPLISYFAFSSGADGGHRMAVATAGRHPIVFATSDMGYWTYASIDAGVSMNPFSLVPRIDVREGALDPSGKGEIKIAYAEADNPWNNQLGISELTVIGWLARTIPGHEGEGTNIRLVIAPDGAPHLAWLTGDKIRYWH